VKILVGYVPTPEGEAAVDAAAAEAGLRGGSVVLVNTSRGDAAVDERYANESELAAAEARVRAAGVEVTVRQNVAARDIPEALLGIAAEEGADLIVIGLRRRTPIGKFILGSTAQRVLLEANIPVLAVKP
jgi:nucleotide-binding universal stress UspA family protein